MATDSTKSCITHPSFKAHLVPNPYTERGDIFHLGTHPKEPKIIYPSGKFIVVRDIVNPSDCFVYRGHNARTTVAKFSPSGFWVASADIMGKVRIWAWDNPEHNMKIEVLGLGAQIKDLAWGPESKRIVVVGGSGAGTNTRAFMWDTGSNIGELTGHTSRVMSCDYRPCRPYRIITSGEDHKTIVFGGPPFKSIHHNNGQHTNFVNCVRFSPDGMKIATSSSDRQIWIYDGTNGQPLNKLSQAGDPHKGSIYSLAWSPDSKSIATASADKTCKLWDVESGACKHTWKFGTLLGGMQVALAFCGEQAVSVSLNGDINLLDPASEEPSAVYQAHQDAITAMAPALLPVPGGGPRKILAGSCSGVVCAWDPATGVAKRCAGGKEVAITAACHGGKVTGIAACSAGIVSVGWDDKVRLAPAGADSAEGVPMYTEEADTMGQPCGIAANVTSDLVAVVTHQAIMLFRGISPIFGLPATYSPTSISMTPAGDMIAVGSKEGSIYIYDVSGDEVKESKVVSEHHGEVTSVCYSPDGKWLATVDSLLEIRLWDTMGNWDARPTTLDQYHRARVTCLAWSPEGNYLASGGLDENVFVWKPANISRRILYSFANKGGVQALAWLSEGELASAGEDHCIAKWNVAQDVEVFDT